jgi:phosphoribosylamine--glycine ligase
MNILLLGSGGREHALAWKIAGSKHCDRLYIAPGNPGTAACGRNVPLSVTDFPAIAKFCTEQAVEMVIVGPEEPLVKGIVDYFRADPSLQAIRMIGPGATGARLEGSKDFAKAFMQRNGVPTAAYASFSKGECEQGCAFLETLQPPYVLKADGLAAGKGVVILEDLSAAKEELREMLDHAKFGAASSTVVIEEFLKGIELSVFVLTDGDSYRILPEAKDYKRIGEGDTGLNTGGMGAVSPVPFADAAFMRRVEEEVVRPTVNGLKKEDIDYKGWIFIGLMNVSGTPKVIEYNVRMGDPETEVVIPRIQSDLVELLSAVGDGTLSSAPLAIDPHTAVTVMLVSGGYPGEYEKSKKIDGLTDGGESLVFHAGTRTDADGVLETSGGRVLAVTSFGNSVQEAASKSYATLRSIRFDGMYFRKDIGNDLAGAVSVGSTV